jgi:hypothetical protein
MTIVKLRGFVWILATLVVQADDDVWWSMKDLTRPDFPEGSVEQNPVDRFIRAKQRELGLRAVEQADRRTLARRLSYNLWGMPLAPERVEAFVRNDSPEAYQELVDELLASPRYGERWARHWMDVVHFGETHGYDKDQPRENAWRYRDYLIRSFNEDKRYDRFVREQLAGDLLFPESEDGWVAPGFLASGPWDLIGHMEVPESKIDGKVARHLDRDDIVMVTMNSFCSLTVQCAQCHDHKADPVTMKDYYSLQAIFAALDRSDREYDLDPAVAKKRKMLIEERRKLEKKVKELTEAINGVKTEEIRKLEKEIGTRENGRSNRFGYHSQVATSQDEVKWVQLDLGEILTVDEIRLFGADEYCFEDFGFPHRFRVEVSSDEEFKISNVIGDYTRNDFDRPGSDPVVIEGGGVLCRFVRVVATKLWSRRHAGQAPGDDWIFALSEMEVTAGGSKKVGAKVTAFDSIEAMPRWGMGNLTDGLVGKGVGKVGRNEEKRLHQLLQNVAGDALMQKGEVEVKLAEIGALIHSLPPPRKAFVGMVHHGSGNFKGRGNDGGKPRDIRILDRGDVTRPGELVQAGTVPGIVPGVARFDLGEDHREGERRIALAEWIVHPGNKLTWRSIVNRVWQSHFGEGLVATANDFGRIGEKPSNPELLDWLAVEFRDGGRSLKELHRLILNSETYRQSSRDDTVQAGVDASNRFLWRQNRKRLDAESVRDAVLWVSGKMNFEMGGPSFRDFVIEKPEHSPHYQYHKADPDDPLIHRRSVYRFLVRSQPQPFMESLDCADPSLLVAKRGETTTSLQALAMLNNAFMVRMAEHSAARIAGEQDPVGKVFELALGRSPSDNEHELLGGYAKDHGLPAMCRVVFNLSEFSYVD